MSNVISKRHLLSCSRVRWFLCLFTLLVGVTDVAALNDPTLPPSPSRSSSSKSFGGVTSPAVRLELNSILIGPERRSAVINGWYVQNGNIIEGYRVVDIQFNKVLVKKDNFLIPLTFNSKGVRKTVHMPSRGE